MNISFILILMLVFLAYMLILLSLKKTLSNKQFIIESSFLVWILFIFLMIMSGFFQPIINKPIFLGQEISFVKNVEPPNYNLQITGHIIFWLSVILFLLTSLCLSKERRKYIIKYGVIGLFSSIIIFAILNIFNNSFTSFMGRFIFINLFNSSQHMGEGGIILIFFVPFYGIIAGSLIGFIISSFKDNKKIYKKSGFYLSLGLLILMLISAFIPIKSVSSFNESTLPYKRAICEEIQGCNYMDESKLCAESDREYPRIPLDLLPSEILYSCDAFEVNPPALTEEELVDGKCPHLINGETLYFEPLIHPFYGGYYIKNNKIYANGELCGEPEKIRYVARCSC